MYTSITEYDCFQSCWCVHFLHFYSVEQEIGSTRETWLDPKITAPFDNKLNVMFFFMVNPLIIARPEHKKTWAHEKNCYGRFMANSRALAAAHHRPHRWRSRMSTTSPQHPHTQPTSPLPQHVDAGGGWPVQMVAR